jgi:AcrR family transcriptional regulator
MKMVQERKNTQVRRRQIISAARKLIVKYGSEHVTVRRMAKEIGVSEGAIYRHFKSKRDVLSFLVDDIENTLIADIDKNYATDVSALETLKRVISDHMSSIEQRKGVSFQVIAEIISLGDKRLNKKIYDVINRYIGRIRDILSEGVKAGAIRQDIDLDATATLFFGMTQGLVNIWALSNYSFDLEQRYASIWGIFRKAVIKC